MNVPGFIRHSADGNFDDVVARIEAALERRGLIPVARVDHAAEAARVGLSISPLMLFVFGNPLIGTGLMLERPTLGIDLPLKLVVWKDSLGVQVGYNDPAWLVGRHDGNVDAPVVKTMRETLDAIAKEATQ